MWDDDMGKPDNLTLSKVAKAAACEDMNAKDTLENLKTAAEQISTKELDSMIAKHKQKAL